MENARCVGWVGSSGLGRRHLLYPRYRYTHARSSLVFLKIAIADASSRSCRPGSKRRRLAIAHRRSSGADRSTSGQHPCAISYSSGCVLGVVNGRRKAVACHHSVSLFILPSSAFFAPSFLQCIRTIRAFKRSLERRRELSRIIGGISKSKWPKHAFPRRSPLDTRRGILRFLATQSDRDTKRNKD